MDALIAAISVVKGYAGVPRSATNLEKLIDEVEYELRALYFDFETPLHGFAKADIDAALDHVMWTGANPMSVREGIDRLYTFVQREAVRRIRQGWEGGMPTDDIVKALMGTPERRYRDGLYGRALDYYTTNVNTLKSSVRNRQFERESGIHSPYPKHFNDLTPPVGDQK